MCMSSFIERNWIIHIALILIFNLPIELLPRKSHWLKDWLAGRSRTNKGQNRCGIILISSPSLSTISCQHPLDFSANSKAPAFYCQSVQRLPAIRQVVLHSLPPFDTMCPHIHQKKTTCFKKDMLIKTRIQDTNFTLIHPTKSGEKFFCQFCLYVCRPDFAVTINFIGD